MLRGNDEALRGGEKALKGDRETLCQKVTKMQKRATGRR